MIKAHNYFSTYVLGNTDEFVRAAEKALADVEGWDGCPGFHDPEWVRLRIEGRAGW